MCQVGIYVECRRGTRHESTTVTWNLVYVCVCVCVCVCEKDLPLSSEAPECSSFSLLGDVLPRSQRSLVTEKSGLGPMTFELHDLGGPRGLHDPHSQVQARRSEQYTCKFKLGSR